MAYNDKIKMFSGGIAMNQPNILIIDAQGGGIGRQLVAAVRQELPQARITAVGANGAATAAMLKAGADQGATGKTPWRWPAGKPTSFSAPSAS